MPDYYNKIIIPLSNPRRDHSNKTDYESSVIPGRKLVERNSDRPIKTGSPWNTILREVVYILTIM